MSKFVDWLNDNCRMFLIFIYLLAIVGSFIETVMEVTIITAIMVNMIVNLERIKRSK